MNSEFTQRRSMLNGSICEVLGRKLKTVYEDTINQPVPEPIKAGLASIDAAIEARRTLTHPMPK